MTKHFYFINDNETTKRNTVADFGGVVIDKQGKIHEQFGAMVHGHFGIMPLFSDPMADPDDFWSEQSAQRRTKKYDDMLESGQRSISSPALINLWLAGVNARYNPVLTAYNLSFDFGKFINTIKNNKIKLVCLPNPYSPTGTIISKNKMKILLDEAKKKNTIVLIDEAYFPFYNVSAIQFIKRYKNLVISRTFAKAWGLAGLRIGYGIANKDLIKYSIIENIL